MIKRNELGSISKEIAESILSSGIPLAAESRRALLATLNSNEQRWSDVAAIFAMTEDATSYKDKVADVQFSGSTLWDEKRVDDDGNVVAPFQIKVSFFFGGSPPGADLEKTEEQLLVANHALQLVKELKSKHAWTYPCFIRTAAEEAARLDRVQRDAVLDKVRTLTEFPRKGMRVDAIRMLPHDIYAGVPDGEYQVTYDDDRGSVKTYKVSVCPAAVSLHRVS